jgi:hypothetical protein
MVCASPGQPQAAPLSPTNPYSCMDKINKTHGGGAPLGTTCAGEFGLTSFPCGFPFAYGGKINYQCTAQDSPSGEPWCYKTEDARSSIVQTCNSSSSKSCQVLPSSRRRPPSSRTQPLFLDVYVGGG